MLMLTWAGIKETSQLLIGTGYITNEMMLNITEEFESVSIEIVLKYSFVDETDRRLTCIALLIKK